MMERLTKTVADITGLARCYEECDHPTSGCDCVRVRGAFQQLAAYEDTGLEPEEVAELKKSAELERRIGSVAGKHLDSIIQASEKVLTHIEDREELKAYRALGTVEHLRKLAEAEKKGLMVKLDMPRKPIVWGDNDHNSCLCPDCGEDLMGIPYGERMILQCPACGQYVDATKSITRAEAEAAQKAEVPNPSHESAVL